MMKMKPAQEGDFQNPENGPHAAVCTRVIDLGTQQSGQYDPKRRMMVTWELEDRMDDGRPFIVNKWYTPSLHKRANLRRDIEAWRGAPLADDAEFDVSKLAGQPVLLSTVVNDRGYANVDSLMRLPKGMQAPVPVGEIIVFDLDSPNWDMFELLSERLQETIRSSPEYQEALGTKGGFQGPKAGPDPAVNAPQNDRQPAMADDFDDDIPF